MIEPLATVLLPGLFCTPLVYAAQLAALWQCGPVTVADHRRDDTMAGIARRILLTAPPRFALAGISMGGYIAFEMLRQAPERVAKLMLLSTSARPDTAEQTERRRVQIKMAQSGHFGQIADLAFPNLLHPKQHGNEALRQAIRMMARETGAEAFVRQQQAIIAREDSRPTLAAVHCPTLVIGARDDALIAYEASQEMARGIAGAQLVTLAECGHLSTLEQPEAVARLMAEFVAR